MSYFFFFKQKTAYEMRISDWSSDVCSSDLHAHVRHADFARDELDHRHRQPALRLGLGTDLTLRQIEQRQRRRLRTAGRIAGDDFLRLLRILLGPRKRTQARADFAFGRELWGFSHNEFKTTRKRSEIGRAQVRTTVTNEHIVC